MRSTRTRFVAPLAAFAAIALLAAPAAADHHAEGDLELFAAQFEAALNDADTAFTLAHAGGMAKDDCHKDKAAGERHWHVDGTAERGGECVKRDGHSFKMPAQTPQMAADPHEVENLRLLVEAQKAQLADAIRQQSGLESTIRNLRAELDSERGKSHTWWQRATRAEDQIEIAQLERNRALAAARGANADAAAALAEAQESKKIAEDAELRARGVGPRVDRRCKAAVEKVVHGDTGWLSDDVEVDKEGRAALSRACLAA